MKSVGLLLIAAIVACDLGTSAYGASTLPAVTVSSIDSTCKRLFPDEPANYQTCVTNRRIAAGDKDPEIVGRAITANAAANVRRESREIEEKRAQGEFPTMFSVVQQSLSQLLNAGWTIKNVSPTTYESEYGTKPAVGPNLNRVTRTGVLIGLANGSRNIVCVVKVEADPAPTSICYALN